ncbi:hypothetical protein D8I24_3090 (plasmid) [Cupriavidus necator H850]|nr:hypothetical protein D8I24_3090 [Cupriavidus necator H850]
MINSCWQSRAVIVVVPNATRRRAEGAAMSLPVSVTALSC